MGPGAILALDPISSSRKVQARMRKNWFMTMWFLGLFIVSVWAVLLLTSAIASDETWRDSDLVIKPGTLLIFIFLIFLGKSLMDADYNAVGSKELLFLMSTTVRPEKIALAKFARITVYNLTLLALALGTVAIIHKMSFYYGKRAFVMGPEGISWHLFLDMIFLIIIASALGLVYSILGGLPLWKRLVGIGTVSQVITFIGYMLRSMRLQEGYTSIILLCTVFLSVALVKFASYWFEEAWIERTSGKKAAFFQKKASSRWWNSLLSHLDPDIAILVRKELVINVQKREIAGNLIAIFGLAGIMMYAWREVATMENIPATVTALVYPVIIACGIYLSATLQCALIGLGSVGKEGTKFWVVRSLPVSGLVVFKAKALAILAMSPITVVCIAIPLPLILGYSATWVVYFICITIALLFAFTGVGLALGARYPNFDEAWGGTPDIMTMYLTMIMCLGLAIGMIGPSGIILSKNVAVGLLSTAFFIAFGFIILCIGILEGAKRYDRIEPMNL